MNGQIYGGSVDYRNGGSNSEPADHLVVHGSVRESYICFPPLPHETCAEKSEQDLRSLCERLIKRTRFTPGSVLVRSPKRHGSNLAVHDGEGKGERDGSGGGRQGSRKRNGVGVSEDVEKGLANQRERSMALNSEGLEGLIPRAKLLLTLGGTFFLGFWPLILITVTVSLTLYFYFGPSFVHDASKSSMSPPPYIDPYTLLEDDRLSQSAPLVK
ncbi:hypothetical protein QJS10_CPB13g00020 [Acorus calamus]|uniref:Uncharacterized protein n=1 Tax=Acorus calamus TaxID=4465 RepID=A0AAV9DHY4_ACOCL|nr:hypothetical protein QJS10_CPB13g00020 [Acorus calamus]